LSFAINSPNGKGYSVYVEEIGAASAMEPYKNVNYNAKGAHVKGLSEGKEYRIYIVYEANGKYIRSDDVFVRL
jgi:hypothetical protein